jgi:hypothetical protein
VHPFVVQSLSGDQDGNATYFRPAESHRRVRWLRGRQDRSDGTGKDPKRIRIILPQGREQGEGLSMSIATISAVWDSFQGSTEERLVLLAIADGSGSDGLFTLDPSHIAEKCRMTPEKAGEILGRLVAAAWIKDEGSAVFRITPIIENATLKKGARQ